MHIKFLNNLTAKNKKDKMQNYLHPIFLQMTYPGQTSVFFGLSKKSLPFDRTNHHALNKVPLQKRINTQDRQCGDHNYRVFYQDLVHVV